MSDLDLAIAIAKAKKAKAAQGADSPQYAPNGVPMNAAAQAEIAAKAKSGTLQVSPENQSSADAANAASAAMQQDAFSAAHPIFSRAAKIAQGAPFVGEWTDELAGLIGTPQDAEQVRAAQAGLDRSNPKEAAALQIGGAIAGSAPMAGGAGLLVNGAKTLGVRALQSAGLGVVIGGVEGAVSGAGRDGDRLQNAKSGGMFGAGAGAVVGAAAPYVGEGVKRLVMSLRGGSDSAIASKLGVSVPAARVIKNALEAGDMNAAIAAFQRAGDGAMLADAGLPAAQLLDASAATGGAAARIAKDAIDSRVAVASKDVTAALDKAFGKPIGRAAAGNLARSQSAPLRQAAYDKAYSKPIPYAEEAPAYPQAKSNFGTSVPALPPPSVNALAQPASGGLPAVRQTGTELVPVGPRIDLKEQIMPKRAPNGNVAAGQHLLKLLDRVPRAAIERANALMRVEGQESKQLLFEELPSGGFKVTKLPDVRQWDYVQRALQDVADATDGQGKLGGKSHLGGSYSSLSSEIRKTLGNAVPEYRDALSVASNAISRVKAGEIGYSLLRPGTTRETVADAIRSGLPKSEIKQGVRSYIDDTLANVTKAMTDPNVDAREAMKVLKDFSSRSSQTKLRYVLSGDEYRSLMKAVDQATVSFELRAALATNSKTAIRQAIQGSVKEQAAPGALESLASGEIKQSSKRFVALFTGNSAEAQALRESGIFEEIATVLTQTKGPQAQFALSVVKGAIDGRKVSEPHAALVGRAVASALALSGSHEASTRLSTR